MKIKINEIPTKKTRQVEYVCDKCKDTFDEEEDALLHHGANHAEADLLMLGEQEFYLFLDKFDFDCWCMIEGPFTKSSEKWSGPGWYCAYMCDNYYDPRLLRAESIIKEWQNKIEQLNNDLSKLSKVSSKNEPHEYDGCRGILKQDGHY